VSLILKVLLSAPGPEFQVGEGELNKLDLHGEPTLNTILALNSKALGGIACVRGGATGHHRGQRLGARWRRPRQDPLLVRLVDAPFTHQAPV
jgi:hypothetical protein